jgi:hypothetical protein
MPPCGVPVKVLVTKFGKDSSFQERLDQRHDAFVLDPCPHPVHQGRVGDGVKACLDVGIEHPAITTGAEVVNLGNRVMGTPPAPEPVGDRQEVGLENRFQYQFQRGLNDPVRHGRNTEAVHNRRARPPVTRDPIKRHDQRRRVAHEVEQVIEPAATISHRPTVKLACISDTLTPSPAGGSSRTPLRYARRTRTIWQYWPFPAVSVLLPPSPAPPGSGCPQLHRPAARGSAAKAFSPPLDPQRLTAHPRPTAHLCVAASGTGRVTPCGDGRAGPFSAFDHHGFVLPFDAKRLARCGRRDGSGAEGRSMIGSQ